MEVYTPEKMVLMLRQGPVRDKQLYLYALYRYLLCTDPSMDWVKAEYLLHIFMLMKKKYVKYIQFSHIIVESLYNMVLYTAQSTMVGKLIRFWTQSH